MLTSWVVSESMNYVLNCAIGDMCILEDLQMQCVLCLVTLSDSALWATRVPRMKCKLAPISQLSAASEDESSECSAVCNSGGRVAAYYLYCCTLWLLHGSWYCRIYWMSFRWTVNRPQYWSRDEQCSGGVKRSISFTITEKAPTRAS